MRNCMKRNRAGLLAAVVLPCVAYALRVEVPPMAMPEFADTEVSTNIPGETNTNMPMRVIRPVASKID